MESQLHVETPLLESSALTELIGSQVYLKMETIQPSGSFKIRGLGNYIVKSSKSGINHIVCASSGNGGMTTAYIGKVLKIPVTIIVPEPTLKWVIYRLKREGAKVLTYGKNWNESNDKAVKMSKNKETLFVPTFDHPYIWEGVESLAEEVLRQCPQLPSAIVLAVGGGSLLCGVMQTLIKKELNIPIVAMETEGAHCFNEALKVGEPVSIGSITSIASCLAALKVTSQVFNLLPKSTVISKVVHDSEAIKASMKFANDHRVLLEPGCAATLAAGYSGIIKQLMEEGKIEKSGPIVFIVCGGNGVTLDLLLEWIKLFNL